MKFFYKTVTLSLLLLILYMPLASCTAERFTEDLSTVWEEQSNEKLVFMSKADSPEGELYLSGKDRKTTRLTTNNRHENNPALSPDGTRVAFQAGDSANMLTWEIYILDLETGIESQLTNNNVIDAHPDWSPDGTKIIFSSFRDTQGNPSGTADIFVMNIDGSDLVQLTDTPWEDNDPEWSPDGTMIAFKSTRMTQQHAREEIFVMNIDGSNLRRLTVTENMQSDHDPSWSPDSNYIVFNRYESNRPWTDITDPSIFTINWQELVPWNIYKVDLYGVVEKLTDVDFTAGLPVYSVDGSKILYLELDFILQDNRVVGAQHRLILMNADGNSPVQMIPDDQHTPTLEYYDW
jgi:dipeptidyl aminopeptidase/acylaminoacyl peptidase